MKVRFLSAFAPMIVLCTSMPAQSMSGTWQGMLPVPASPRVAIRLWNADNGSLHGTLYLIDKLLDKGPLVAALTSVSFAAPELSLEQVNLTMGYQGKVSADGKSLIGTWTQDKQSYPLTLLLATPETLWKREDRSALAAMAATADPAFEVATIKPSPPDAKGYYYRWRTRYFEAKNRTVRELIEFAYEIRDRQLSGGPSWMAETKFDIAGEPDADGLPSLDQYRAMLKKLLAVRFQLQIHTVQQSFPVYALTRDEGAPRLPHSDPEFDAGAIYPKGLPDGQTTLHFVGHTMPMFADILMNFIQDRQIVDETGLSGHFEFTIAVPSSALHGEAIAGPEDDKADAFRRAVQPLGFKLVPAKAPLEVIVVDHMERPTGN